MRRYAKYLLAVSGLLATLMALHGQFSGPTVNRWTPGADLSVARTQACSVSLADGRLLVAGGQARNGVVNSVEFYGADGTFAEGAAMLQPRAGAACVGLPDGRVLVLGGTDGNNSLASAEVFNPKDNTWVAVGDMGVARSGHRATLTPWGSVLVVGGNSNGTPNDTVESFSPFTGQFNTVGKLSSPRADYAMTAIANRRVMIAGGSNGAGALNTIDIYDAGSEQISPAGNMLVGRRNFAIASMLDGRVLITGGFDAEGRALASSEIYDPTEKTSVDGPQLSVSRANHEAYTLPHNGRVMLMGGTDGNVTLSTTDAFEPWTGKFARTASMNTPRAGQATSLLRRGSLIVTGGRNVSGVLGGSEVYGFATVATDKSDYHPGEVANITGTGWKPGEQVQLKISSFPLDEHNLEFTAAATADGTGQFRLNGFNVDASHRGARFMLHATGSESEAQTFFTDGQTTVIDVQITPGSASYPTAVTVSGFIHEPGNICGLPVGNVTIKDTRAVDNQTFTNTPGSSKTALGNGLNCSGNPGVPRDTTTNGYFSFTIDGNNGLPILAPGSHDIQINYETTGSSTASEVTHRTYIVNPVSVTVASPAFTPSSVIPFGGTTEISTTVQVTPSSWSGTPNGQVNFNSITLASNIAAIATDCPGLPPGCKKFVAQIPNNLAAGTYSYTATFSAGNSAYSSAGPSAPSNLIIQGVPTTTSAPALTPSLTSPQPFGTSFTLSATVAMNPPGAPPPTGTVIFFDNGANIGEFSLVSGGNSSTATSGLYTPNAGNHSYTATYLSNSTSYQNSQSGSTAFTISKASVVTTLTTTPPATPPYSAGPVFGDLVTFTATVPLTGGVFPTGTMQFLDSPGGTILGNIAVNPANGQAVLNTTALTVGVHQITATFTPTAGTNFTSAGPVSVSYTVSQSEANFTVAPSTTTANRGQTINISITGIPKQGVSPTGTVTITENGVAGATKTLTGGNATFPVTLNTVGSQTFSLQYSGDGNFLPRPLPAGQTTLASAVVTVSGASTTTTVSSNPSSPVLFGTSVTFTASVTSSSQPPPALTGNVEFSIDAGPVQVVPLVGTTAQLSTSSLAAGPHSVTARYLGDANYAASPLSAVFPIQVNPATTTVSVNTTSGASSGNLGSSITYRAAVTPNPAGVSTSGSVSFTDNGLPLACNPVNVVGGIADCLVTYTGLADPLRGGSHAVIATFTSATPGNISSGSNASTPFLFTVNKVDATFTNVTITSPITYNTADSLTFNINAAAGAPAPSGTLSLYDNGGITLITSQAVGANPQTFVLPNSVIQSVRTHTLTVTFTSGDTNYNSPAGSVITTSLVVNKATPTATITYPAASQAYGQPVSVPVTINGVAGGAAPTGTVVFTSGATALGTVTLSGGSGTLNFNSSLLAQGPNAITAVYSGDANYTTLTPPDGNITVTTAATTTTVSSSSLTSASGQLVTFTATVAPVAPSTATPAGTITFTETFNGVPTVLQAGVALVNGQASLSTASLVPGSHIIGVAYTPGNANFTASNNDPQLLATKTQVVNKGSLGIAVTSSLSPSNIGQAVNLTATLTAVAPAVGTPANGSVRFFDGGNQIGAPVALPPGGSLTAVLNFAFTNGGNHSITATYDAAGDANFNAAGPSLAFTQSVNAGGTTTTISAPGSSSTYGSAVTITATVAVAAPAVGTPTGSVSLLDGSNVIGSCTLVAGTCNISYGLLSVGTHTLNANYQGDPGGLFASSQSTTPVTFTVDKAEPAIPAVTVTGTGNPTNPPFNLGQTLTLTAQINKPGASVGGAANPTGTVTFYDNGTPIGTGTLNSPATLTTATTAAGAHTFTVTYGGDPNYNAVSAQSGSSASTQVSLGTPTVTVTASPNPVVYNGTTAGYTLTATVTGVNGFAPNGTVDFSADGGGVLGCSGRPLTINGNAGTATCSPAVGAISTAVHSLTAAYTSASPNYNSATTAAGTPFTITPALINFLITSSQNPSIPGAPVTFTATASVAAGAITPIPGVVNFSADGNQIAACQGVGLAAGVATCAAPAGFTLGAHVVSLTYTPLDANAAIGAIQPSGGLIQQVNQASVDFTITSSAATSVYGQTVALTAVLAPHSPAVGVPTGSVTFFKGGTAIGSARILTPGATTSSATLSIGPGGDVATPLEVGSHSITVLYGGDASFGSLNSGQSLPPSEKLLVQTVNRNGTLLTAPAPDNSVVTYGQPIIFKTTITGEIPPGTAGAPTPTGTISFFDGSNQIGNAQPIGNCVPAAAGCSQITVSNLAVGSPHGNITARYNGDANYCGAGACPNPLTGISAAGSVTINKASTTATVNTFTSATSPQPYGTTVPITVTVTVNAPSSLNPGAGTVSLYDGSTARLISSVPQPINSAGIATFQVPLTNPALLGIGGASPVGTHTIIAVYNADDPTTVNNYNPSPASPNPAQTQTLTVTKANTLSTITSTANPTVTGQTVTFNALVSAPASIGAPPSGTVTFFDGSNQLGSPVVLSAAGGTTAAASLTLPASGLAALSVGTHVISASYAGDLHYSNSATSLSASPVCVASSTQTCAVSQLVNKAVTTTTLSPSINSSVVGEQVILTAAVVVNSPGTGVPTGVVQFFNGSVSLGSANLVASGPVGSETFTATLTLNNLPQGNLQLTAVYSGDPNYLGSTSPIVTQAVNKPETTITVTTNLHPAVFGQPTTFTATVTPKIPGSGVPTGTVQFFDGTSLLVSVQLVGGQATYTSSLAVGLHDIAVKYSGDDKYQPMISPPIPQLVNKKPLSLFLSSSAVNAVASQVLVFTAQLNPQPEPGMPFPSGQVAFYADANVIGVGNLSTGIASITATLPAGQYNIKAQYTGDANYTDAQSNYQAQTVNLAPTNTQLTSSINPSVYGQSVTFTLVVGVPYPGTVPASGRAQLYDNGVPYGSPVEASNGSFQITVPNFAPGTHNVYATFIGNQSFATSTSPTLTQIVNKAPTTTALAVGPSSSTARQQVKMVAVVNVPIPGSGAPTGTVQFDNTTTGQTLGTAPIVILGGVYTASITTDQLNQTGAPQVLVATYSGDTNFATSSSNPNGQSVFGSQISVTSAASYFSSNFAPDQIASIFGDSLADTVLSAQSTPLPTALSGTTVEVTDSAGVKRLAQLFFVSPAQINFLMPTNTAFGLATVTVTNGRGATSSSIVLVTRTAAGLFSANASGKDVASAQVIRVNSGGAQTLENVAAFDAATRLMAPVAIDMGAATDQLYLVLYGSGIRYNPGLSSVKATVNGINVPVQYAGAAPGFVGLDQVNLGPLPASVRGAGTVNVVVTVDGQPANTVTLTFR